MTMPRPDTPSPQPLSRKQERGSSTRESDSDRFLLRADWDAAPGVHAFTTLRPGAGSSQPPFDTFNLGNARSADGDDPAVVARNPASLLARALLPSPLRCRRGVPGR